MEYAKTVVLDLPYDEAVPHVKETFAAEGFGTLTEIDVRQTLQTKISVEIEPYVILGTCNPNLAHQALEADREVGLLLPCNVVVRADGERTVVHALNAQIMATIPDHAKLEAVAQEANERIDRALATLQG